jgi:hypothetical protein
MIGVRVLSYTLRLLFLGIGRGTASVVIQKVERTKPTGASQLVGVGITVRKPR